MTSEESQQPKTQSFNSAEIVPRQGISIVWFVPFIALIFGGWLAFKVISEQGTFITIEFENGSGIVPKKTEVRYKGLVTGMVTKVIPSDDLQHVIAEVEMSPKFTDYLTDNTLFWLVSADISLQGVSGLDTLISGSYINILPDTEEGADSQEHFIALNEAPALDMSSPGLHLTLQTDVLGSVSENSPITFKQLPIGYVTGYRYDEQAKKININVFIEQIHAHLVKENSLFWNTSGVQVTASLSTGLKINTDSIASIIAGGIAVDTLSYQEEGQAAKNGEVFTLHPDFQSAEVGHEIELTLAWNSNIDHNAAIIYQGFTIGAIESITKIDPVERKIIAKAKVNPRVVPYLTDNSQFYLVSPEIGLTGISNAKTLLTGTYIGIRPSLAGNPQTKFIVYNNKPAFKYDEPGLHIMLEASSRSSLQVGSNILYKQQVVGNVQAIKTIGAEQHQIYLHIQPEFEHYVTPKSRFFNNSGVKLTASLQGVEIAAESLQTILSGGITFINDDNHNDKSTTQVTVKNGHSYKLFDDMKMAQQVAKFTLKTNIDTAIKPKTRLLYRGEEVGSVQTIEVIDNIKHVHLGLLPEFEYILKAGSQFWLVEANLSLSGATDTQALFSGNYITFNLGKGESQHNFTLLNKPPAKHPSADGLQLTLLTDSANVATPGSAVSYRGVIVGQVDNVELDKATDKIQVNITIDDEHTDLISANTRFYNASGITLSGGLGDFVMKTESLDAILRGGISFYNPVSTLNPDVKVNELDSFSLFDHYEQAQGAGLAIKIHFNDIAGLKKNTKVIYQEQEMGFIERLIFNDDKVGVEALVMLNDFGSQYAKQGAKFWKVEPEIGLVGSKNLVNLLDGAFIALLPAPKSSPVTSELNFTALALPPTVTELPYGLNITLSTHRLGSVRVGNPVLYRQIKVGEVIGIDLSENANSVNVFINIAKRYAPLVKPNSQFWNTSGINIEAGIFSGINIDSESVETLIAGGIAFATPEQDDSEQQAELPQQFILHQEVDSDWLEWQTEISLKP